MSRELSTMLVDTKEDLKVIDRHTKARRELIAQMVTLGVPTQPAKNLPMDVLWTVDGQPCMFDLKTPEDVIASVDDGRLHEQVTAAQRRNCILYGFLIEGEDSKDDGVTVGYGPHAWLYERYDNLLVSLQEEGAKIVRSKSPERTPQRLASLYRRSAKEQQGSWHAPQPHQNLHNMYTDRAYRRWVEALMSMFPDMGETRANSLLDRWPPMEILGATDEGIEAAAVRWRSVRGIGTKLVQRWEATLKDDFSSPLLREEARGR